MICVRAPLRALSNVDFRDIQWKHAMDAMHSMDTIEMGIEQLPKGPLPGRVALGPLDLSH